MIITRKKIQVTYAMLVENNMTRGDQLGIPVEPLNPSKGLHWKTILQMKDADFDALEEYFLSKK